MLYDLFTDVSNFFLDLTGYLTFNEILYIFLGLFLLTVVCVLFTTSRAYESRLIKAIDMFNNYFIEHSQINEENLVSFNNKMKSKKVPKQLRKQWQQFVLYRENNASYYMSFENCVANPLKNSSYKRDVSLMNIIAYILASVSLLLNLYDSAGSGGDFFTVLSKCLVVPVLILLINYLALIFLDLRHNAIVSDLYQNYQYFEVNIDKATKTLPDYVDYEVLFDKNEIKKGIPILYAYLQKRAEEEQRELERARLKNIEHEKFNFDESGVAGSLVLERAMQEAENYIAERKKYNQDTEQISSDITQEDMNYREITKEYNRQMQVSKESFANYKAQLEEVSSQIEANYLKKQQQQELDRQRNLEKEFDTATERHKKIIESFQAELDSVDQFRAESKKTLESAMMSEFSTYSSKVYDEAKKVVEERHNEKVNKLKDEIKQLEEKIVKKDQELETIYTKHQQLSEAFEQANMPLPQYNEAPVQESTNTDVPTDNGEPLEYDFSEANVDNSTTEEYPQYEANEYASEEEQNYNPQEQSPYQDEIASYEPVDNQVYEEQPIENNESQTEDNSMFTFNYDPNEDIQEFNEENKNEESKDIDETPLEKPQEVIDDLPYDDINDVVDEDEIVEDEDFSDEESSEEEFDKDNEAKSQGEEKADSTIPEEESIFNNTVEAKPRKKAGRPRKIVNPEDIKPKRSVGRPKKQVAVEETKKKVGRPKKEVSEVKEEPKKKVGRPRKEVSTAPMKKRVGRPKKVVTEELVEPKKRVGRPKKEKVATNLEPKKKEGRPRKDESKVEEPKKKVGRPRKNTEEITLDQDRHVDIDEYLKEIDQAIANENAVIERARKELEKKAKIDK